MRSPLSQQRTELLRSLPTFFRSPWFAVVSRLCSQLFVDRRWAGMPRMIGLCVWMLAVVWPTLSHAQRERPADVRPPVPEFTEDQASLVPADFLLPPLTLPVATSAGRSDLEASSAGIRVFVSEFEVRGSSILTQDEISELTAPYLGRALTYAELLRVRDALTQAYLERGYVTSGAVLPEQSIRDGRVRIDVQEGRLDEIVVETDGRLTPGYVSGRVALGPDEPVNVQSLQGRLQALQSDPRIRTIRASLQPTDRRGLARLELALREERPFSFELDFDNSLSPSIGAERAAVRFEHLNLSGIGDSLELFYARSEGLTEWRGSYSVPLTAGDTRLELEVRASASDVVEDPFEDLDIESRATTYALRVRHAVWNEPGRRLELALAGEVRRSKSFLLGSGFSFAPGAEDGVSRISVVRFSQDLTLASRAQAFSLRSTLSVGLGALGATTQSSSRLPDSRFVAWLAQVQYARRLQFADAQLIARADVQLSDDPLLGLEQFSVGGRSSVRGYRENARVRDNGALGSLELRVPVWTDARRRASLELAPFFDIGRSWNRRTPTRGVSTLASAGIGGRLRIGGFEWELYYADDLRELPTASEDRDLQDRGLHFRVRARY